MKKILVVLTVASAMWSCKSGDKKADDTKTDTQVGVQNVNGNIPDTTNAIDLTTHKKDSSTNKKDTAR